MSRPRIGALFAGYGGLDMAVQSVYGGDLAWYSEIDKGALKVLNHRFPDVPNVGDVTTADWSQVEPVDILTGGSPCQDLSHAGRRAGMTEGTRSNLWVAMREAIAQLRPSLVVWENVRGAYSAAADSDLVDRPGLLDSVRRRDGEPVLRALGRVLGDLSDLGYDASWHGLRAADVGAPHGRFRVFVVASDTNREGRSRLGRLKSVRRDADGRCGADGPRAATESKAHSPNLSAVSILLPTPNPFHAGNTESPEAWRHRRLDVFKRTGTRHGPALSVVAWSVAEGKPLDPDHYMPDDEGDASCPSVKTAGTTSPSTPSVPNASKPSSSATPSQSSSRPSTGSSEKTSPRTTAPGDGSPTGSVETSDSQPTAADWGKYGPAVARWADLTGRPAPEPTQASKKGTPQLSPTFVEWMMGLPAGWVTDAPGITRNEALKALGNGVVPQQAAEALRVMASWEAAA